MLRQAFTDRLKQSMKAREARTVSTIRLILAELKGCDVAAPGMAMPRASVTSRSSGWYR